MSRTITISSCSAAKVTVRCRAGSSSSPGEQLLVHGGHAPGRGHQAVASGVLADGLEQLGHEALDTRRVDASSSAPRSSARRSVDRDGALVQAHVGRLR